MFGKMGIRTQISAVDPAHASRFRPVPSSFASDPVLVAALAAAAALVIGAVVAFARRRPRGRSAPARAGQGTRGADGARDALFHDRPLDALLAGIDGPGPLAEAAALLRAGRAVEAKRLLEHPDVQLGWECWPEHAWALAKARLEIGSRERAVLAARGALAIPGLEARGVAQAWAVLRELGEPPPPALAGRVLAVVAEVATEAGPLAAAAFADGEARQVDGAGRAWTGGRAEPDVHAAALALVEAAGALPGTAVPPPDPSPPLPPPPADGVRWTLLTPAGRRAVQAAAAQADAHAHPLHALYAATQRLLAALRERTREVARITVTREGEIRLRGRALPLDALRAELARVKAADGAAHLHRPDPRTDPSPVAHAVFLAILDAHLPVTLSDGESGVESDGDFHASKAESAAPHPIDVA